MSYFNLAVSPQTFKVKKDILENVGFTLCKPFKDSRFLYLLIPNRFHQNFGKTPQSIFVLTLSFQFSQSSGVSNTVKSLEFSL